MGGPTIFATHYLDNPEHGDTKVLDGWSYLGAALFGPVYVLLKGFPGRALAMAAATVAIAACAAGLVLVFAVSLEDIEATIVTSVIIASLALLTQGAVAVELVRRAYLAAGYREGYY